MAVRLDRTAVGMSGSGAENPQQAGIVFFFRPALGIKISQRYETVMSWSDFRGTLANSMFVVVFIILICEHGRTWGFGRFFRAVSACCSATSKAPSLPNARPIQRGTSCVFHP
jgi:hypothetical protein